MKRLQDKVAIVTGSTSGLGEAIALLFAKEGAKVTINGRNEERGKKVVEKIQKNGEESLLVMGDVSKVSVCRELVEKTVEKFGKINILINNAGFAVGKNIVDHTEEEWDRVIGVNLKGAFLLCKYGIPELIKNGGGTIVNMGSMGGIVARYERASYCASKGGMNMLTKQLALDYASNNIRVNIVCPGVVETPLLHRMIQSSADPEGEMRNRIEPCPQKRMCSPLEVAYAFLFLASEESSFVTGASLVVDGGYSAH